MKDKILKDKIRKKFKDVDSNLQSIRNNLSLVIVILSFCLSGLVYNFMNMRKEVSKLKAKIDKLEKKVDDSK